MNTDQPARTLQVVDQMQKLVDELTKVPQFRLYVRQAKLSLLDSRFEPIDQALRSGLISGRE